MPVSKACRSASQVGTMACACCPAQVEPSQCRGGAAEASDGCGGGSPAHPACVASGTVQVLLRSLYVQPVAPRRRKTFLNVQVTVDRWKNSELRLLPPEGGARPGAMHAPVCSKLSASLVYLHRQSTSRAPTAAPVYSLSCQAAHRCRRRDRNAHERAVSGRRRNGAASALRKLRPAFQKLGCNASIHPFPR